MIWVWHKKKNKSHKKKTEHETKLIKIEAHFFQFHPDLIPISDALLDGRVLSLRTVI